MPRCDVGCQAACATTGNTSSSFTKHVSVATGLAPRVLRDEAKKMTRPSWLDGVIFLNGVECFVKIFVFGYGTG